ncbi:DUF1249 domain-containing protein [Shewanella pealeana]|uniref:DUF1249 domain-containing protein n=1 Tax=Shewanella pealeana (strain ATCC 700345 / ANG-SQ1) TaxID=398579 RepID=A8H8I7_SHEPA|nr:DUF1249 domain-containing protein [Shewanella pealeana]ABV88874.1 protein of unknown function DUF1249 [Shewanella pealeana ATCC 700345]
MSNVEFAKKSKYKPNISQFLALCGRNYMHIQRWLTLEPCEGKQWLVQGEFGQLDVCLLENTRYTQLVQISRCVGGNEWLTTPKVSVRIYHDAKLAEVLTSQQIYQLRPVYDYPNMHMHHRDEKYQVNAFLEELLKIDNLTKFVS